MSRADSAGGSSTAERRVALTVEYDGTRYVGFQRQSSGRPSIQAELERTLRQVLGVPTPIVAAGRTDAGVHARGQVVAFSCRSSLPIDRLPRALNAHLPGDIVVQSARQVPHGFHPRKAARSKLYRYSIWNGPFLSPFWRLYAYRWERPLDLGRMRQAARLLEGTHDFRAFRAAGGSVRTSVRTLFRCEVESEPPLVHLMVEGDGFLYNMVRIIAGSLLEVGDGRRSPESIAEALASGRRQDAGRTLPPQGLCLMGVRLQDQVVGSGS